MKHAILLALIESMRASGPLRVVETHAGAGLYDLEGEAAARSSEAAGGVGRLMEAGDLSPALLRLRDAVVRENSQGRLRFYPGSPLLSLGAADRYLGYELRPDDFTSLAAVLEARSRNMNTSVPLLHSLHSKSRVQTARAVHADGYAALAGEVQSGDLVLIDPPFERADDYERAAAAVSLCIARGAAAAVWAPIKDLETLDAFTRRIEALHPATLTVAEVRLRPLANPMKLNGCAMVLVDTPDIDAAAAEVCAWVAKVCGEPGGRGEVTRLIP